jgi:uncharacterized membrane protein
MDANVAAIIIGIVASLPGVVALIYQARKDKETKPQSEMSVGLQASKDAAEVVSRYTGEIILLRKELNDMRTKVDLLEASVAEKDAVIDEWRFGIERLCAQLVSLGHQPVWRPKAKATP